MITPNWFWSVMAFLFGINIGSFLNVVIWRLPRGGSLLEPRHSYCPRCEKQLEPIDLVPIFSFLLLGRRCRRCKQPISWRYLSVELLTGLMFVALYFRFPLDAPNAISFMLFTALLIPMTFIDLDFFHIPTSLNLLAFFVAVGRDVLGIVQHEPGHELLWGWLPRSILGAIIGILIFGAVRIAGWLWKRVEAMGLGDVLLARAMGAMLVSVVPVGLPALRLFPAWVLLSCASGLIVGPALIFIRRKQAEKTQKQEGNSPSDVEVTEVEIESGEEEESSLGQQFFEVGWCLWLGDLFEYLRELVPAWRRPGAEPETPAAEDDFVPAPSAIPFGPFLAIGFLAAVFIGELLTRGYLAYALPKPVP